MKKLSKKQLKRQIKRDIAHDAARAVRKKAKKRAGRLAGKLTGKLALFGLIGFAATFTIYIFNLENKLIYYVVRPFLNRHYDNQKRDRRIV